MEEGSGAGGRGGDQGAGEWMLDLVRAASRVLVALRGETTGVMGTGGGRKGRRTFDLVLFSPYSLVLSVWHTPI
jgi:hypothetical protein